MRAFLVVNCQSALVWLALRSCSQAAISSMRICLLGMRRSRHWDVRTPSSDSAKSSQLPCFGVEVKRLAERKDDAVPAVEAIDRATWLAMRRLETTGMLKLAEGSIRVLHRASELTADHAAGDQAARASELHKEAERSLRMAKVLATGGFVEEAPMLIAKTIGCIAAAKLAALGELPAGARTATPAPLRALRGRRARPLQTRPAP